MLVAPDKFKGSLSATEAAASIAVGLRKGNAALAVDCVPVADGGEGTLEALIAAGFRPRSVRARDAAGRAGDTAWARSGTTGAVELAAVCGLGQMPAGQLDPLGSSSYGVGEVVSAALDAGCAEVVLAVGGSASTDGGVGMIQALGARLLDPNDAELPLGPSALDQVAALDLSGLHPAIARTKFVVACDVDNPLCGPAGAAAVYGPQKGAGPADVVTLERRLRKWGRVVAAGTGHYWSNYPGAGAAGGVGFAAMALLGASMRPGIDLVMELVGLPSRLAEATLVATGEGSLDGQTIHGKVVAGVAAASRVAGVPAVALAGQVLLSPGELAAIGIARAWALTELEPDLDICIADASRLLTEIGVRISEDCLRETCAL